MKSIHAAFAGACLAAALPAAAHATAVTLSCTGSEEGRPYQLTLVYQGAGADHGTLSIKAPFGEYSMPAIYRNGKATTDPDETMVITAIRSGADVEAKMPDKTAIEACVRHKLPPDQAKDGDIVSTVIGSCAATAPLAPNPVPITLQVAITFSEPSDAYVSMIRTYKEPSTLPDGVIKLDYMPPPTCTGQ